MLAAMWRIFVKCKLIRRDAAGAMPGARQCAGLMAAPLFKVGGQAVSLQLGARYWDESPEAGPEGWGLRVAYTLVFPE
jgi:hypothetical protein